MGLAERDSTTQPRTGPRINASRILLSPGPASQPSAPCPRDYSPVPPCPSACLPRQKRGPLQAKSQSFWRHCNHSNTLGTENELVPGNPPRYRVNAPRRESGEMHICPDRRLFQRRSSDGERQGVSFHKQGNRSAERLWEIPKFASEPELKPTTECRERGGGENGEKTGSMAPA